MIQDLKNNNQELSFPSAAEERIAAAESPLLHNKLRIPALTPTLLTRPRLSNKMHFQSNGFLTLLSAPAGFGKTTLVSDWVRQENNPTAWLTLDEYDNDPVLFWRYLITALQIVDKRLGVQSLAVLHAFTKVPLETIVTILINDIDNYLPTDKILTLILDDFHWIHNAAIHQSLSYLLQHQPPQLHLILLTRADPPLSLARLRVEGRLVELRAADLRLTPAEMAAYFNEVMRLEVSTEVLSLLAEKIEGWVAGLQLAALSIRQQTPADAERLVHTFSGLRQHVFAYLMEEVLIRQTEEVRQFLQQTAVLQRCSASLCTAVTGRKDAGHLLYRLAADNLFISPLDDEGQWYRYHPFFAEMLRVNLDEGSRRDCHRRAANWYTSQGLMQDAMRHAQDAEDFELMADLLTQTYKTLLAHALLVSMQKWLAALPVAYQSPRLRLAAAWCRVYESNEAELGQIVASIMDSTTEVEKSFQGEMLAVRAIYASLYGNLEEAIQLATEGLALIDPQDYLSLAAAYQALGNAYRYRSDLDAAFSAYTQARRQFENMGNVFMSHLPLYRMASIQILQGRLHQALQTYESIRLRAQAAGYEPLIMTGEVFGYLSDLYWEWNDLEQAGDYARQEIELAQSGHMLLALVDGYLRLSAVRAAQGDETAAREALGMAAETAVLFQSASVSAHIAMIQAQHELACENLDLASAWADDYVRQRGSEQCVLTPLQAQVADLLLARIWMAKNKTAAALELLQEIVSQYEAAGRIRLVVEANVLLALAWASLNQNAAARKALICALTLAKPEGYIRVFVEYSENLQSLLSQVRYLFPDYVSQLLKAMTASATLARSDLLVLDPLTEREQEILRQIAQGYSNRQIADVLFISVGTVKGHVNHIFSKLDVKNRTQALLRAREFDLLDI